MTCFCSASNFFKQLDYYNNLCTAVRLTQKGKDLKFYVAFLVDVLFPRVVIFIFITERAWINFLSREFS